MHFKKAYTKENEQKRPDFGAVLLLIIWIKHVCKLLLYLEHLS